VDLLCRSALRRWRLSFGRPGVPGVDLWKGNEEGGASRSTDDEEGESSPPSVVSVGVALDFFSASFPPGLNDMPPRTVRRDAFISLCGVPSSFRGDEAQRFIQVA
jgi:hypothetical protein